MTIQQINLFNPEFVPRRDLATARYLGVGVLIALAVSVAAAGFAHWSATGLERRLDKLAQEADALRASTDALAAQLASRSVDAALTKQLDGQRELLRERRQVAGWLRDAGSSEAAAVSEYYRALARRTVEGVWLTGFALDAQRRQLRIEGRALKGELVPRFLGQLGEEALLKGSAFARVELDEAAQDRRDPQDPGGLTFRLDTAVGTKERQP